MHVVLQWVLQWVSAAWNGEPVVQGKSGWTRASLTQKAAGTDGCFCSSSRGGGCSQGYHLQHALWREVPKGCTAGQYICDCKGGSTSAIARGGGRQYICTARGGGSTSVQHGVASAARVCTVSCWEHLWQDAKKNDRAHTVSVMSKTNVCVGHDDASSTVWGVEACAGAVPGWCACGLAGWMFWLTCAHSGLAARCLMRVYHTSQSCCLWVGACVPYIWSTL
jgi:hypothetical protein